MSSLIDILSSLSLNGDPQSAASSTQTVIAFDALNFLAEFFEIKSSTKTTVDPFVLVRGMEIRVQKFCDLLRASGISLIAVIDADTLTEEAKVKWMSRREREVTNEERNMLVNADLMIGEAFARHGVKVLRPQGADTDDVLASLAATTAHGVLSRDGDFFRYSPRIQVYTGWERSTGRIRLIPGATERHALNTREPRRIDTELGRLHLATAAAAPARGSLTATQAKYDPRNKARGRIERGSTTSSDRRLGNLHDLARPLRAAVYHRLRLPVDRPVREIMPIWDDALMGIDWSERAVLPDARLDALLDDVRACERWLAARDAVPVAAKWSDPVEVAWRERERTFARCVIAAEIVSAAALPGDKMDRSVLALLRAFPEYQRAVAAVDSATVLLPQRMDDKSAKALDDGPLAYTSNCRDCGRKFGLTKNHLSWFRDNGYSLPIRCEACKEAKKTNGGGGRGWIRRAQF